MKKFPSYGGIALEYKRIGYDSLKELSDLLAKDRYDLSMELKRCGISPEEYGIFHEFVGSTPSRELPYDYYGGLIEVALRELLSKYGVDD